MNDVPWLVTWTTYGSWLPGDPRGFRTFRGREYVPPPERSAKNGEPVYDPTDYADRYARAKEQVSEGVRLTLTEQRLVCDAIVAQLQEMSIATYVVAVGAVHVHLVARFGMHLIRPTVGRLKSFATRALPNPGNRKRVWTKNCHMESLPNDEALEGGTQYVRGHADEGAVIGEPQAAALGGGSAESSRQRAAPQGGGLGNAT